MSRSLPDIEGQYVRVRLTREDVKKIIMAELRAVVLNSWINLLLVFVPIGFALYYAHIPDGAAPIFIVNFIAILPLAALLGFATEQLALQVGETLGGLLNASFGNAVELIVSIQALVKHEIVIVKTSLIGSMLSNLLLVLGMSFYLGGFSRTEQHFNITMTQTSIGLLALCVGSLVIPTVFHAALIQDKTDGDAKDNSKDQSLSRGIAVILLFIYACYLVFQFKSHTLEFNKPSLKVTKKPSSAPGGSQEEEEEEQEEEKKELSITGAIITLAISTILIAFCSEFMVSSINGITEGGAISKTFVGLILLPIVGNAAEHVTAVKMAYKDKMDLAISVAIGSSIQIGLFVLPLIVILGWAMGADCMTLRFDSFLITALSVAVLLVNYLIQDSKSHWLEGMLLMCLYVIVALASWYYPNPDERQC